jgi:hypothetical protein
MRLQPRITHPRNPRILLQPLRQRKRILGVSLGSQAQRLDAEKQLLRAEGVQRGAQVAKDFDTDTNCEGDVAESLPELEAVVTRCRLDELGETGGMGAPVEFAGVNDDTGYCGAVAADPFLGFSEQLKERTVMYRGKRTVAECTTMSAPCLMG